MKAKRTVITRQCLYSLVTLFYCSQQSADHRFCLMVGIFKLFLVIRGGEQLWGCQSEVWPYLHLYKYIHLSQTFCICHGVSIVSISDESKESFKIFGGTFFYCLVLQNNALLQNFTAVFILSFFLKPFFFFLSFLLQPYLLRRHFSIITEVPRWSGTVRESGEKHTF